MADTKELMIELESMIDSIGLQGIAILISEICNEKADHINHNWQDTELARTWKKDGNKFSWLVGKLAN